MNFSDMAFFCMGVAVVCFGIAALIVAVTIYLDHKERHEDK